MLGLGLALYPSTAQWAASYRQSQLIGVYPDALKTVLPDPAIQLAQAHAYNAALSAGVDLLAGANVPTGTGISSDANLKYDSILSTNESGLMARLRFPAVGVDLPIYHGTSEHTLLIGVGHLEGSHFPVGGSGTHSVLTAHRGLAESTMFTHLDKAKVGDRLTIEVFGEVLTYEVFESRVVEPTDTDSLRAVPGEDIVTLVTCTPLGINTHRILVSAERVTPTPIEDLEGAGKPSDIPGFPWWALGMGGGLLLIVAFMWRSGYRDAAVASKSKSINSGTSTSKKDTSQKFD